MIIELWDSKTKIKKCKDKKLIKKIDEEINQRKKMVELDQKRSVSKKQELEEINQHLNKEQDNGESEDKKTERVIKKLKINPNSEVESIDDLIYDSTKTEKNKNTISQEQVYSSNDEEESDQHCLTGDESDSESDIVIGDRFGEDGESYDEEMSENDLENSEEQDENSDEESHDEDGMNSDGKQKKNSKKKLENGEKNGLEEHSESYLTKQLTKVFGEKAARKRDDDEASVEEEVDEFFINKKVKKYKPTEADLKRYLEYEDKQRRAERGGDSADEQQIDEEQQFNAKSTKKGMKNVTALKRQREKQEKEKQMKKERVKFVQSNAFNTQFSSQNNSKKELHPSWAAKKRQHAPIKIDLNKPATNKKIVFDS